MIEDYLRNNSVEFEVDHHEAVYTAQEAAAAEDVTGYEFAKTVIVTDGQTYYMLVLPAPYQVDLDKASELIGTEVRLAEEEETKALFSDCDLGAEPPFGSLFNMDTCVDESLGKEEEIAFRGGSHEKTIRMSYADYIDLEEPRLGDFKGGIE